MRIHELACLTALVFLAPACGGSGGKSDPYTGNMKDFTYGARANKTYGPSAAGETMRFADLKGRFVWVDFSAPWCPPCRQQAPVIRKLESDYGDKFVFLTMMTTDQSPSLPATQHTARQWASQYGLDARHVFPSQESARTIPQHILFSPLGQTLEWRIGMMHEHQIKETLARHTREWHAWYEENKDSPSVMLSEIGDLGE